ncbi:MAG: hypothetical protein KGN16_12090 [Burkholderiales bacterium]|nr:hypothetical protein [Burkholderiales bacterium]
MGSNQPWFVGQRAESLALIFLTRRPTLHVQKMTADLGIDYLLAIGEAPSRYFGLQVKGAAKMSNLVGKSGHLIKTVAEPLQRYARDSAFPIAILAIDITSEAMLFGWIKAPAKSRLVSSTSQTISMRPATDKELDLAVQQVNDWYDSGPR